MRPFEKIQTLPMKKILPFLLLMLVHFGYGQNKPEFRGVWVATVENIDWPSKGNHNPDSQKAEFIRMLDIHKHNGLNAVVVQIRPSSDAFYPSPYEPWSAWLTGKQGMPPSPYYDPLLFMITETHKRKMAFHAWMNPYRAEFNVQADKTSSTHVTRLHPEWFITYGNLKYFDPGNKESQNYVCNIVRDVVSRYEIDAIHFDDYFYPYKIPNQEFNDKASYKQYGKGLSLEDWRRSNTDSIIEKLSRVIKKENSKCLFGISPFGIWRNKSRDPINGSNTVDALSNYDDLYADVLKWLCMDWIDYVAPQLYWEIGHKRAPFEELLSWWNKNTCGKNCYIGLGIFQADKNKAWKDDRQLLDQIEALRKAPNIQGMIFYSSKHCEKNPKGWMDEIRENYFYNEVPVPSMQ